MKKNSWRNIFELNQIVQIVGIVIAAGLILNTVTAVQKNYRLQAQVDELEEEIEILELENQNLTYNIAYYQTDEFLELAAREKFNKKASGERAVALPKEEVTYVSPEERANQAEPKPQHLENLDQWLYFLFGQEPS